MLILFAPGAPREAYFEGAGRDRADGRAAQHEELAEFYRRDDTYWVWHSRSASAAAELGVERGAIAARIAG